MQSKLHLARKSDIKESDKEVVAGQFFLQKIIKIFLQQKHFALSNQSKRNLKSHLKKKKKRKAECNFAPFVL